uniref:Uncharacterized protein n=1 Tax=Magnetococcus massalia (strain MO-1) TaxID=451514 RepID=A0A1S7LQA1_MAGMO|nr:Protein of unknown function. coiled-coil [Candidatus Magnetococcus massalia]
MYIQEFTLKDRTLYQVVEPFQDYEGCVRYRTIVSLKSSPTIAAAIADLSRRRDAKVRALGFLQQSCDALGGTGIPYRIKRVEDLLSRWLQGYEKRMARLQEVAAEMARASAA